MFLLIIKHENNIFTFNTLEEIIEFIKKMGYQFKEIIICKSIDRVWFWGIANDYILCFEEVKKELEEWRKEIKNEKN